MQPVGDSTPVQASAPSELVSFTSVFIIHNTRATIFVNKIMIKRTRSLSKAICNTHRIFLFKYNWMTLTSRVT